MGRKGRETAVRIVQRIVQTRPIKKKIVTAGPIYEAFGRAIRKVRIAANLRQYEVADKVGLTRSSIVQIEQGCQRVLLDDLFVFANALDTAPRKLLDALIKEIQFKRDRA